MGSVLGAVSVMHVSGCEVGDVGVVLLVLLLLMVVSHGGGWGV